ncbi:hypothetical protein TNCV_4973311 [Trichonephila clavipes]|nr:hypothetical protein TNCV_4973311 [Trichonephila clavipes]
MMDFVCLDLALPGKIHVQDSNHVLLVDASKTQPRRTVPITDKYQTYKIISMFPGGHPPSTDYSRGLLTGAFSMHARNLEESFYDKE